MNRICNLLTAASVGAGLAYFFDPVVGRRRRSLARDQINHFCNKTGDAADATWRDVQNRAYGMMAELMGLFRTDKADDEVLVQRVRSKIGRYISHPSAIEVTAKNGSVRLAGPVLAHEVDDLFCGVRSVRGVRDIEDHLDVHKSAENISALQGGVPRTGEPSEFMQENWSPTARLLAGMAGATLMSNCLVRRTPASLLTGAVGAVLSLRALANQDTRRVLGVGGGRRSIDIQKTIDINQPVEDVFAFLSNPQNYPRITDAISSVRELGDGRIQKTIVGPAGAELTVEERITRVVPNEMIASRSEPGSPIQYAKRAWFEPLGESRTRVHIEATYNPPGGVLAHSAAWLAGIDLKSALDDFLMRAKSYLETGKQPHDAAKPDGAATNAARKRTAAGK
jgi:uncharacterized membrane protein